jgi:putative membrane protein
LKKINLLFVATAVAGLLQACSAGKASSATDSSATTGDTGKAMAVQPATQVTAMADTAFALKAAVSGTAEVALGKIALAKATDPEIKQFAKMMVTDHDKANAELKTIAAGKNMTLPVGLDAEHQAKSDSLNKLSGKDFDRGYVSVMVESHQKTLALMQSEASGGTDADLKAFASKTAPVVKTHLDVVRKIQTKLDK